MRHRGSTGVSCSSQLCLPALVTLQKGSKCRIRVTLNKCLLSKRRGSILVGALYPWQTTKISAEVLRLATGFVASTFSKSCLKAYRSEL